MHRDIARELEGTDYPERQAALETWRSEFNEPRPHEALTMKVPAEIYVPSARPWSGTPEQIIYPRMSTRKVKGCGTITYQGVSIFVSQALAGCLEPQAAAFVPALPSKGALSEASPR